jgi:hypothetical protein
VRNHARCFLAVLLSELLVFLPCQAAEDPPRARPSAGSPLAELSADLQKSYLQLFQLSPKLHFTDAQFDQMERLLDQGESRCKKVFNDRAASTTAQRRRVQDQLHKETATITPAQRHDFHCRIQNLRAVASRDKVLADHAIPVAYENMRAKLELIRQWPSDLQTIRQEIADGSYRNRRWGDVQDIGFRDIASGQADDIRTGEEAIRRLKRDGMMPPEITDPKIVNYVNQVAQRVAEHSDLHVPLHVYVLNSKEINAFSLPGGFLFVERGLLEAVDDESELAGVLGHEIGHVCARHAHKLMEKATLAGILYQAAEVAGIVLTGGAATIGTYYALQYGFYGLGMVLDLSLLGVSRNFELQADQLGIQYAWNAGYDPSGFIRFFDKMATSEGYVDSLSWFYDHPPFYERMVDAEREIMFLPKKPNLVVNTSAFLAMQHELKRVTAEAEKNAKNKPSLLAPEKGCGAPQQLQYKPGQPIETICGGLGA